ncbi:hypothetical protein E0H73_41105 [Kribbella pittospori]|uniref:Chromosome segregation ATPase n=1 Tax=Kribbella pittospori TaxID=722689 RepID=A0A4R0K1G4_9ACTN|nr:hypothetical protein [Kribbella pittospori]TCC51518.1 hypothetical protein E0H73_41105 [Kribbella pittospori]
MTYQLSRVRFASVGDRAARFTDLTVDLTSGDAKDLGQPIDSILWLRNGGGKSSLLSLFFALLLPLRKDFMGKAVKRQLEDYIASGDTSHTVAEWVNQSDDALLEPQRLITGAVYEWADRRKPMDPDRDRDKLKTSYYSFFAVPGALDLDRLPLDDESGRRRPRSEFVRCLEDLAAARPQEFLFSITEKRGQWMETLAGRSLDPSLFGYQKQMNHSEGGVAELFNFPSTDKFIDFLIDLTVDNTQPDLIAANLRTIIGVLSRKPDLLVDRDFCAELAGKLDVVADRHLVAEAAETGAAEARLAAARLGGAFRSAATAYETDAAWFREEEEQRRTAATKLDSERNRLNDRANELLRVAATHRRATAEAAWNDARTAAETAKDESRAWEASQWLAERMEVQAEASSVQAQLDEEERETAPLRAARDDAAIMLKSRLESLAGAESAAEAENTAAAGEADQTAETEAGQAQRDRDKATECAVRADGLGEKVAAIEQAIETAVGRGDLPDAMTGPRTALAEARTAKRQAAADLEVVTTRRDARPARRATMVDEAKKLVGELTSKAAERDQLILDHGKLLARADSLATDARLAELMQLEEGGRLDLWAEAGDLRVALTHAASMAEAAIVDTRVDTAEDDRALEGLRTDGYLPSTRDAQRAAEALVDIGVSARPGWELLRDLVAEQERASVLENVQVAELAAGVVVADSDLQTARAAVKSGQWHSVAHVAVSSAAQLQQVLGGTADWFALPSDPALFDRAAAELARTDREVRREEQDTRISLLHDQASTDRALLAAMETLLRDCPAGHLEELEKAAKLNDDALKEITAKAKSLDLEIARLDLDDTEDAGLQSDLSSQLNALAGKIERLSALEERTSELPALREAIERLENDARHHRATAAEAETRVRQSRTVAQAARSRVAEHKGNRERYLRDAREISLLNATHETTGAASDEPVSVLQSRFNQFAAQWQTVTSESVLAERLKGLLDRGQRVERELGAFAERIRERAAELLRRPEGQDADRRTSARGRAQETAYTAQRQLSTAESEFERAEEEVKQRTPRDRPRHAQLEVEPATETEARELARGESERATELSGRVTSLHREAEEAGKAAAEAGSEALVLQQRAGRLGDAAAPIELPDEVPPFSGDDAEAELQQALGRLTKSVDAAATAGRRRDEALREVRRVASQSRFSVVPETIRDRFTADDTATVAASAAARAAEMRLRQTTIEGQLADIGRDQRLVVVEIAGLVRGVLANLESANRHSKLPDTLGGWGNEQFLRIRFVRPSTDEDLHTRIDAVVDRIVAEGSKPEGLVLLKQCVHEAVAPRGFTVKVLKPNSDLAVEPVDVTHLGKFSGGEKLTVCVALYCTLARLRAVNRGRGNGALGGTLVLDNPLGTASHVALLRLQRDVAAAHGVQLVYTTGVEDLGAVGQFPNVVRMRNAPGALRTRRYVVLEDRYGSAVDGITAARVSRSDGGER